MVMGSTVLKVADNTGALIARCIQVKKGPYGKPGSLIRVSIRKTEANANIKVGSKHLAVIVRSRGKHMRKDGSCISCNENVCVLVGDDKSPKGTSIFGPVMREVRWNGFLAVSQQASEVI